MLDDGLVHLNDLHVTWGFDLGVFLMIAHTRRLPPARPATAQPRPWIHLKGVRLTPPRPP